MNAESWYAIWTRSHCERLVEQQLTARGFSPFLPEVATLRPRSGQASRQSAKRAPRNQSKVSPMFPGYLFVHDSMTKERYVEMLGVRGIVRVLEDGWTRLTPIPDNRKPNPETGRRGACWRAVGSPKSSIAAGVARFPRAPCQTVFPGLGQRSC